MSLGVIIILDAYLLGASLEMSRGLFSGREDSSRLDDVVGSSRAPRNLSRVPRVEHLQNWNYFAILKNSIDLDVMFLRLAFCLHNEGVLVMGNGTLETAVSRVVL